MRRTPLLCLLFLRAISPAQADILRGPYEYPSPVTFELQTGLQLGLGGYTPGGYKILLDYSHRFASSRDGSLGVWFFADLGFVVGVGPGVCLPVGGGPAYECGPVGYGSAVEIKSGIQVTFRTAVPLVPYVKLGAGVAGVFAREYCEDSGASAPLSIVGGGARYFFTRRLGLTLGGEFALGPGFYGAGVRCFIADHNELYRALSFLVGLNYSL